MRATPPAAHSAVRAVMVLMRSNLDELPALLRLLHAHRVPELLVQRLSNDLAQPDMPARYIPIRSYIESAELRAADLPHATGVFEQARDLACQLGLQLHLPRLVPREPTDDATGQRDAREAARGGAARRGGARGGVARRRAALPLAVGPALPDRGRRTAAVLHGRDRRSRELRQCLRAASDAA